MQTTDISPPISRIDFIFLIAFDFKIVRPKNLTGSSPPISYISPPLTIGWRLSRIRRGRGVQRVGNASLSIHLPPILTSDSQHCPLFLNFLHKICISTLAKRCSKVRGRMEEFFLPNFKKLIDDAQAPRMSLQKFSSQKSAWRERERIFSGLGGIGEEIETYRPPRMRMSELT